MYIEIATEHLFLVPLGPAFLASTNAYALDPENTEYMLHLPNGSPEETLRFLRKVEETWAGEDPRSFEFAVLYKKEHIGAVNLSLYGEKQQEGGLSARLGWIIRRDLWGQGFGPEAAEGLIDYFHKQYGVRHFTAMCDRENTGSLRTMEKLGMKRIGENPGRRNRLAREESVELVYELWLPLQTGKGKSHVYTDQTE